jgi:hypothetical protein
LAKTGDRFEMPDGSVYAVLVLEFPETLAPGRARERIAMRALAGLGRVLRLRTTV